MAKKSTDLVQYCKHLKIGLRGTVTERNTQQLFLKNKRLDDLFKELMGETIHLKIKEDNGSENSKYYFKILQGDELLQPGIFFENGSGKFSIKDIFQEYIGKKIDIAIDVQPKLWHLLTGTDCGCCCD